MSVNRNTHAPVTMPPMGKKAGTTPGRTKGVLAAAEEAAAAWTWAVLLKKPVTKAASVLGRVELRGAPEGALAVTMTVGLKEVICCVLYESVFVLSN